MDSDSSELENLEWHLNVVGGRVVNEVRNPNAVMRPWLHGAGNAYKQKLAAINCNYENTDCYDVRIMPSITSIDH